MSVVIETTVGDLTVDLFLEDRPLACLNFIKLCKLKYYNFNLFHTIEQDFIAQTGDPTGAGDGGSSVWGVIEGPRKRFFEAESVPKIFHTSVGLLSLVSPAKNLVGSQFFFTLAADLTSLDGQHCVIGEVVEGHETLRRLNEAIVDDKFRPYQDIRITHTVILEDPFPDMRGFRAPSRSPSPTPERLQNGRIAADEDIDDTEGKTMEEIQEMLAEREAKARATILEIVGDLPDAEAAPPENVLFVCKLNPVTTEDDLEIIFSRFGKVVSCEVIRDKKSGDSLQYAFVEFENEKACEAAYFKMDNVLIDDRRIHVDFSQSVARVKWRGKGRGVEGQQGRLDFKNLRETDKRDRPNSEERRRAREQRHELAQTRADKEHDRRRYENTDSRVRHDRRRENNDIRKNWRDSRSERDINKYSSSSMNRQHTDRSADKKYREDTDKKRREKSPNRKRRSESGDRIQSRNRQETSDGRRGERSRERERIPDKRRENRRWQEDTSSRGRRDYFVSRQKTEVRKYDKMDNSEDSRQRASHRNHSTERKRTSKSRSNSRNRKNQTSLIRKTSEKNNENGKKRREVRSDSSTENDSGSSSESDSASSSTPENRKRQKIIKKQKKKSQKKKSKKQKKNFR